MEKPSGYKSITELCDETSLSSYIIKRMILGGIIRSRSKARSRVRTIEGKLTRGSEYIMLGDNVFVREDITIMRNKVVFCSSRGEAA
jgi:hypothetical protein